MENNTNYDTFTFTVKWDYGSINNAIIKYLKEKNIDYFYNHYFELIADMHGSGQYYKFAYKCISGDIYEIAAIQVEDWEKE